MDENRASWELWQASGTQWRGAGMGVIGLDYGAVFTVAEILGIDVTPAVLSKIQALEATTLKEIHAGSKSDSGRTDKPGKIPQGREKAS